MEEKNAILEKKYDDMLKVYEFPRAFLHDFG
jgi:hypothetical protein